MDTELKDETKEYQKLHDYFVKEHNKWFDPNELKAIARIVSNKEDWEQHIGLSSDRVEHNPKEKAFQEEWIKENEPLSHINHGYGILQDLFFTRTKDERKILYCHTEITKRERMIVATVIQWLGTNCGMSFLKNAVRKFGYKLVPDDEK